MIPVRAGLAAALLALTPIASPAQAPGAPQSNPAPIIANYVGEPGGTGAYPARGQADAGLATHTIYRPVTLPKAKLPIVLWANGACADNGRAFEGFLREIASHGYFIVALGPPRSTPPRNPNGPGGAGRAGPPAGRPALPPPPPPGAAPAQDETQSSQLIDGLNWAIAQNSVKGGPYAGRLDIRKIAVMGQSCGGLQAIDVSPDPRITASGIWNSGVYITPGGRSNVKIDKARLKSLHAPIAYFIGGPSDIAYENAMDDYARIDKVQAMIVNLDVGHGGTYGQPNGGPFGEVAVDYLDWRLKGDKTAARTFAGPDCKLCKDPKWTIAKKGFK